MRKSFITFIAVCLLSITIGCDDTNTVSPTTNSECNSGTISIVNWIHTNGGATASDFTGGSFNLQNATWSLSMRYIYVRASSEIDISKSNIKFHKISGTNLNEVSTLYIER